MNNIFSYLPDFISHDLLSVLAYTLKKKLDANFFIFDISLK